jgi:hypothetical protein
MGQYDSKTFNERLGYELLKSLFNCYIASQIKKRTDGQT